MELMKSTDNALRFIKKYKYCFLVVAIGLVLMSLPSFNKEEQKNVETAQTTENLPSLSQELSEILSRIDGAGRVEVMLSVSKGTETLYQTDEDITSGTDNRSTRKDTVTLTDAQREEAGLVRQVNPPVYQGAVVVCDGAEDPNVRYAIVQAVANATALGADKISVLKMK